MSCSIIYVLGMPRSGTTLLQRLIASSDDVITYPETWFFVNSYDKLTRSKGLTQAGYTVSANGFQSALYGNNLIDDFYRQTRASYVTLFGVNDRRYVLEKTPANLLYHESIISSLDVEDKIVLLIRNDGDVFGSMLRHFDAFPYFKSYKLYSDVISYRRYIDELLNSREDILLIDYNDIVSDLPAVKDKLENYLKIKIEEELAPLPQYKGKNHGDSRARSLKKVEKRNDAADVLSNILVNHYFVQKSFLGYILQCFGWMVVFLSKRVRFNFKNKKIIH